MSIDSKQINRTSGSQILWYLVTGGRKLNAPFLKVLISSALAWLFIFCIAVIIPFMAEEDIPLSSSCARNSVTMVSFELYASASLSWQKLTYFLIAPSYLLSVFFLHAADNVLVAYSENSFAVWCRWSIELLEALTWGWGGGYSLFSEVLVMCCLSLWVVLLQAGGEEETTVV